MKKVLLIVVLLVIVLSSCMIENPIAYYSVERDNGDVYYADKVIYQDEAEGDLIIVKNYYVYDKRHSIWLKTEKDIIIPVENVISITTFYGYNKYKKE